MLAQRAQWSDAEIAELAATNIDGVLLPDAPADETMQALHRAGLITVSIGDIAGTGIDHAVNAADITAVDLFQINEATDTGRLWATLQTANGTDRLLVVLASQDQRLMGWMLQMSLPTVPVINLPEATLSRDDTELVRSLVFWRQRFGILFQHPDLVHAGDGLLLYRVSGWLVALNLTPDDTSIGLEHDGSMWLMLGTHRQAQLQGGLLDLPAWSGAILANERAVQGGSR